MKLIEEGIKKIDKDDLFIGKLNEKIDLVHVYFIIDQRFFLSTFLHFFFIINLLKNRTFGSADSTIFILIELYFH